MEGDYKRKHQTRDRRISDDFRMYEPAGLYNSWPSNLHHIKSWPEPLCSWPFNHGVQDLHPRLTLRCSSSPYRACRWRPRAVRAGGHPRVVGADGAAGPERAAARGDGGEPVLVRAERRGDVVQPRRGEGGDPGHDQDPAAQPGGRAVPHQQRLAHLQRQAHHLHLRRQDAARLHPL